MPAILEYRCLCASGVVVEDGFRTLGLDMITYLVQKRDHGGGAQLSFSIATRATKYLPSVIRRVVCINCIWTHHWIEANCGPHILVTR
jgi:hypothetical protein